MLKTGKRPDIQKLFGTDGVRGRANHSPMNVETALALGRALGSIIQSEGQKKRVVIGKDTRLSGYMFENALIAGLCSMGVDTFMLGPLPTPAVAFITRAYRADAGIMISASHNPFHDNGIKFFDSEGFKLPQAMELELESMVAKPDFNASLPPDDSLGKNHKIVDAAGRYIESVKATFPKRYTLKNLKIVLDCAHGASYHVAPCVFRELDGQVHVLCDQPNGLNINAACGSLHPQQIQKGVIDQSADVGIALDGDADRVIMVDENAQIVDGDTILAICALDMLRKGNLKNRRVVGTIMSNFGFIRGMEERGIDVVQAPVGDKHVIRKMLEHDCNLGGEQSGHLIFLDYNTTGDGILAALQVLRIMIETDSKLSDLASVFHPFPQSLVNVRVREKPPVDRIDGLEATQRKVEKELGKEGRVLIRYSGTEPICRVMVEGPKKQMVNELARVLAGVVQREIGSS